MYPCDQTNGAVPSYKLEHTYTQYRVSVRKLYVFNLLQFVLMIETKSLRDSSVIKSIARTLQIHIQVALHEFDLGYFIARCMIMFKVNIGM